MTQKLELTVSWCEVCNTQREWQPQRKRWFNPRDYKCQTCGVVVDEYYLLNMDKEDDSDR